MLRLEAATGLPLPAEAEPAMLRHLGVRLDNPLGICCHIGSDPHRPVSTFDNHSQRETLLALAALAKCRQNEWAAAAGGRMVRAPDRYVLLDDRWDNEAMGIGAADPTPSTPDPRTVWSHGRVIEGLLALYESAGDPAAAAAAPDIVAANRTRRSREPDNPTGIADNRPFPDPAGVE